MTIKYWFYHFCRIGRSVSGNVLGASTRLLDNATLRQSRQENLRLSRTANILSTRLRATQNYSKAPESEALRHEAQNLYRKQKDRYIDRPLPPIRKKRFNLGPGRAAMESQWERFLERYLIITLDCFLGLESRGTLLWYLGVRKRSPSVSKDNLILVGS